jgi:hypothetical protein
MSTPRVIRHRLLESFRTNPRPLFDTLAGVYDGIPPIDPASIRPRSLDASGRPNPPLSWDVEVQSARRRGFVLIADVATQFDVERVWLWPIWRTAARAELGCPAWLMVCVPDQAVADQILRAFDHERAALPLLIDPDAKLLAKPSVPAPYPRFDLHL